MTGGKGVSKADNGFWNVGKSYLLGTTAAAIETNMLRLTSGMHGEEDLRREVEQFEVSYTPSGQLTMAAKGERHDNTVLSVALAHFGMQDLGFGGPSRLIGWR